MKKSFWKVAGGALAVLGLSVFGLSNESWALSITRKPSTHMNYAEATAQDEVFDLRDFIPQNLSIRNQMPTGTCWSFAFLSAMETSLAMKDFRAGSSSVVYDYSEAHLNYALSSAYNEYQAREVDEGASIYLPMSYVGNGYGPVFEVDMPFIAANDAYGALSKEDVFSKSVGAKLMDVSYISFAKSEATVDEQIEAMKEHVLKNGAVATSIHGAGPSSDCYNEETAGIFCPTATIDPATGASRNLYPSNHAISIVGWDDSYAATNFKTFTDSLGVTHGLPTRDGAWVIRNSWGEDVDYTEELRELICELLNDQAAGSCASAEAVPDTLLEAVVEALKEDDYPNMEIEYETTAEGTQVIKRVYEPLADKGFMYVSYEDLHLYNSALGVEGASNVADYDTAYSYFKTVPNAEYKIPNQTYLTATTYEKKAAGNEYMTEVALQTLNDVKVTVYVNPTSGDKDFSEAIKIPLKNGDDEYTKTMGPGYHALEFERPVEISGSNYVVILQVTRVGSGQTVVVGETPAINGTTDKVKLVTEKQFIGLDGISWMDVAQNEATQPISYVTEVVSAPLDEDVTAPVAESLPHKLVQFNLPVSAFTRNTYSGEVIRKETSGGEQTGGDEGGETGGDEGDETGGDEEQTGDEQTGGEQTGGDEGGDPGVSGGTTGDGETNGAQSDDTGIEVPELNAADEEVPAASAALKVGNTGVSIVKVGDAAMEGIISMVVVMSAGVAFVIVAAHVLHRGRIKGMRIR